MARTAFVIGGTGQIGRAVSASLLQGGWRVTVAHRGGMDDPALAAGDVRSVVVDRQDEDGVRAAVGVGTDVLIDAVPFTPGHAQQLLGLADVVGSVIAVSTAAVYTDDAGRTLLDATAEATSPRFAGPIGEDQRTVAPGAQNYATRKRAMELTLLEQDVLPATVVRPSAVHGPGSNQPREWFYLRRLLDRRPVLVHGFGGQGTLHPTSVYNLAELIRLAAERPGTRVLNSGDPDAPDELEIARSIAAAIGCSPAHLLLPGPAPCASPWSLPVPVVLDMSSAEAELGYRPVMSYRQAVAKTCEWIEQELRAGSWERRLHGGFGVPGLGAQVFVGAGHAPFDYEAEDGVIASLRSGY
jgi:nucleoside-diphosphate-sugar epimerase